MLGKVSLALKKTKILLFDTSETDFQSENSIDLKLLLLLNLKYKLLNETEDKMVFKSFSVSVELDVVA